MSALHTSFPRSFMRPAAPCDAMAKARMISQGTNRMKRIKRRDRSRPNAIVGAGQLVSAVWNTAHSIGSGSSHFNVYRMSPGNGRVSRLLCPSDLPDLVKLCQVLALTLADDASLSQGERHTLADLTIRLDEITRTKD